MKIRWNGSEDELLRVLERLPSVLAGQEPDPTGLLQDVQLRLGADLLSHLKDAYATKSEGGTDEMGISWAPLAPSTLALRRKVTGAKTLAKLKATLTKAPLHRKRLIAKQRARLIAVYQNTTHGAAQRRQALRFLKAMKPFISPSRYAQLAREIRTQKPERGKKLAFSGGFAQILRDTGRLFNSLAPKTGADTLLLASPGKVMVGSNVTVNGHNLLDLHDSDKPRKKKKDGSDRLPRRQVLPDAAHPIPAAWWQSMVGAYVTAMNRREFWLKYLGPMAG